MTHALAGGGGSTVGAVIHAKLSPLVTWAAGAELADVLMSYVVPVVGWLAMSFEAGSPVDGRVAWCTGEENPCTVWVVADEATSALIDETRVVT